VYNAFMQCLGSPGWGAFGIDAVGEFRIGAYDAGDSPFI